MEEEGSEQRGLKVRQVWTQLFGHWHCYETMGETRLASRAHRNYVLWILRVSLDAFPPLNGNVYLRSKQNYVGFSYDSKPRLCNPWTAARAARLITGSIWHHRRVRDRDRDWEWFKSTIT